MNITSSMNYPSSSVFQIRLVLNLVRHFLIPLVVYLPLTIVSQCYWLNHSVKFTLLLSFSRPCDRCSDIRQFGKKGTPRDRGQIGLCWWLDAVGQHRQKVRTLQRGKRLEYLFDYNQGRHYNYNDMLYKLYPYNLNYHVKVINNFCPKKSWINVFMVLSFISLQLIHLGLWLGSWRGHIKPPHFNKSYQLVKILHCHTWPIIFWVHVIYNLVQIIISIKSRQHNYHSFVIKLIHRMITFDSRTIQHTL